MNTLLNIAHFIKKKAFHLAVGSYCLITFILFLATGKINGDYQWFIMVGCGSFWLGWQMLSNLLINNEAKKVLNDKYSSSRIK